MDNKLSELSKPVAWEVKGILCHSEEEARVYVGEPDPLYSQEYVSALLAELEAKDQAHRVHAARLISERGVLRERVAELEAKLATPVQLQDCDFESVAIMAHWCTDEQLEAWVKGVEHAKKQIRAAGFKVEEE
ncbi:hypothetical protein JY469_16175 [Serratia marcescens]|nr:hypothetical protein [Serratia marcescens]